MVLFGWDPLAEIFVISIGTTLISQAVYQLMVDHNFVDKAKEDIKELQKKLKGLNPKQKEYTHTLNRQMDLNMKLFKQTMKPSMVTIIPFLLIFAFMSRVYTGLEVLHLPFTIPLLGKNWLGWIGTFVLFSFIFTTVIQRVMTMVRKRRREEHATPT
jgi:uncharacterized membrane protein (DUF106 family)